MLSNITLNYFYSQLFWFFISFIVIYISFSWFLYPALSNILNLRSEQEKNFKDQIKLIKEALDIQKAKLDQVIKSNEEKLVDIKHNCLNEIKKINQNLEKDKMLEKTRLVGLVDDKIKKFKESNDFDNIKQSLFSEINKSFNDSL